MSVIAPSSRMELLYHFHRILFQKYLCCGHNYFFSTRRICREFGLVSNSSAYSHALVQGIEKGLLPVDVVNRRGNGILFHTHFMERENVLNGNDEL